MVSFFNVPRSTPIAAGIVLALRTLPVIIIASRAAIRAVPPSIRQAALALGASKMQVVLHHVLPLSLPGALTCLLYTSPSPRDRTRSRMPSSA